MRISLDRCQIMELLPHRGDALFLMDADVDGWQVKGSASWPASHPHLAGHFPGFPIVPGVFLIEAAAQLAGVLLAHKASDGLAVGKLGLLAGVRRSLLHAPTLSDQVVRYALDVERVGKTTLFLASGTARDENEKKLLTVEVTIAVADQQELQKVD